MTGLEPVPIAVDAGGLDVSQLLVADVGAVVAQGKPCYNGGFPGWVSLYAARAGRAPWRRLRAHRWRS